METGTNKQLKRVAIQGGIGAFHEIAAIEYYGEGNIEIVPMDTFEELAEAVKYGTVDEGIMAIENSVAGTLLPNYSLLLDLQLKIKGETYLRIQQNLMALHGQEIDDLREVYSHPIAINQSRKFFKDYRHIKLVEAIDTALSARDITEKQMFGAGAIASRRAADLYGLNVIAEGIETNKRNYTRFLVIVNEENHHPESAIEEPNKSSMAFTLPHHKGSLSQVLSILSYYDNNLTKIQSLPIVGKEWEYMFYIDLLYESYEKYLGSVNALRPLTSELIILGEYIKGTVNYENTNS